MKTLIQNGYVVDGNIEANCDIAVEDGVITAVGDNLPPAGYQKVVDATGHCVLPGLVDMHVHLRDPGLTHKEDVFTGAAAAAAGGVTSLLCMPNTKPALDHPDTVRALQHKAETATVHLYQTGAITCGLAGDTLTDFAALKSAGVVAVSDDGRPVANAKIMAEAMMLAKQHNLLVTSHCEDLSLVAGGVMHEGEVSRQLGVPGMPRSSEDIITARDVILAETYEVPVHIAHVSTKGAVAWIRLAKQRGVQVTAETCPHYFSMTERMLQTKDADYRMNPPLRTDEDVQAIIEGLQDGTIDAIVTDHAPHTPEEKADFLTAPNGVIGMETSFAASYTHLVLNGHLTLPQLVQKMSRNPAQILGIPAGTLTVGCPADLVIVDLAATFVVDPTKSHSKSQNMIYKGQTLTGKVVHTMLAGKTVYQTTACL